jgi:hypothetical protein
MAIPLEQANLDVGGPLDAPVVAPIIDPGDVSGSSTSPAVAASTQLIENYSAEGGGAYPIAYGEHIVAGQELARVFTAGTPDVLVVDIGLGGGQTDLGQHGEWEDVVYVRYGGEALGVSPNATTDGYRFYRGYISTGVSDPNQPVDPFLPTTLAHSGTPHLAVRVSGTKATENRPDKIKGRYKCRRMNFYDGSGNVTGYGYSTNPAYIAVDRIRSYYEHKYRDNIALAQRKLREKIDWESLASWANFNDTLIPWDNGASTISIKRFECNIAFTGDLNPAAALDQICASCGAWWQYDGPRIVFMHPGDQTPIHHFNESNILDGSMQVEPRDLRNWPNVFEARYRDFDDQFLGFATTPPIRELDLIKQFGEIKTTRTLPNMRQSQAQRIADRWKRLEAQNPFIITLTGDESSLHLLPGRFVTVTHQAFDYDYQLCLALSMSMTSSEEGVDTSQFTLQQIDTDLYSDLAHGPRQGGLTP